MFFLPILVYMSSQCSPIACIVPPVFLDDICSALVPPRWSLEPRDVSVLHREMAVIHCAATGNPRPTISWRKSSGDTQHSVCLCLRGDSESVFKIC